MSLSIVPVSFADARAFVAAHHRHHAAPTGHKFSIGVADSDVLVGVAVVGRPISRVLAAERPWTLEVLRTARATRTRCFMALLGEPAGPWATSASSPTRRRAKAGRPFALRASEFLRNDRHVADGICPPGLDQTRALRALLALYGR